MSRRTQRVGELLRAELAEALRREVADPRVRLVTLTRIDLAPDFSQALCFWSTLEPNPDIDDIQEGLSAASSYVRGRLAKKSALRRMPRLEFRYDATLADGDATLALLGEIANGEES